MSPRVAAGKGVPLWDGALAQQIYLGDQAFIERMQALMDPMQARSKEIPRSQRRASTKSIQHYLDTHASRGLGMLAAVKEGQHSLTAVANHAGLSVSRISRIVQQAARSGVIAKGKT